MLAEKLHTHPFTLIPVTHILRNSTQRRVVHHHISGELPNQTTQTKKEEQKQKQQYQQYNTHKI